MAAPLGPTILLARTRQPLLDPATHDACVLDRAGELGFPPGSGVDAPRHLWLEPAGDVIAYECGRNLWLLRAATA